MEWTLFCALAPIAGYGIFFLSTARFFKSRISVMPTRLIKELETLESMKPIPQHTS